LVYLEGDLRVFPVDPSHSYWGKEDRRKNSTLRLANNEAFHLRNNLTGMFSGASHPILYIFPYPNSWLTFNEIFKEPYITKKIIYSDPSNWDNIIKPLSVIRVEKRHKRLKIPFKHVGIYLGNNQVCHIYDYGEEKWMEARVTNMNIFLDYTSTTERFGMVEEFRPLIPFVTREKVI